MKKIFSDIDYAKVGYYQSILENSGIKTHIKNETLSGIARGVIAYDAWPELWVLDDDRFNDAVRIIEEIEEKSNE